tara:strand:+ start:675 stop:863 length:189 start_codon:yes stop_codon:yes gene_type:complete
MSELKQNIVKNILDRKFSKANSEFGDMMRNKVYDVIKDFKRDFKYVTQVKQTETGTEDKTDG